MGTHKEEGHYAIAVGEGSIRVLGRWWLAAAQRGEVEADGKFIMGGSFGFQPFVVDVDVFSTRQMFVCSMFFFVYFGIFRVGIFLQLVCVVYVVCCFCVVLSIFVGLICFLDLLYWLVC